MPFLFSPSETTPLSEKANKNLFSLFAIFLIQWDEPLILQPKFAMRSEPHQSHEVIARFLVNQHQVGLNETVPLVLPVARQHVVAETRLKQLIVRQCVHNEKQVNIEHCPVLAFALTLVIALELACPFNRPHEERSSAL